MTSEIVLVTGASGFIASHVVQQLLQTGHHVRGTVRDLTNEVKVKPLETLCPEAEHPLELVEADLLKPETWAKAVEGCTYVIHVASGVKPDETPKDENELIEREKEEKINVLKACQESGTVKRVVLTSSSIAVTMGSKDTEKPFDETDWLDPSQTMPLFVKSKVLSEKAAWDFMATLPKGEQFELSVVNPGLVWGPVICKGSSSISTAKSMLEGKLPMVPPLRLAMVDVRDVAAAHISAMTAPDAAGKRHILTSESMWFREVAEVMSEEFKPQGYKISTWEVPHWFLRFISMFSSSVSSMLPMMSNAVNLDNSRMVHVLGVNPRSMRTTILDMCYSMIETGQAKKTDQYTGLNVSNSDP